MRNYARCAGMTLENRRCRHILRARSGHPLAIAADPYYCPDHKAQKATIMPNNNIIPTDISATCCANLQSDAVLDFTKQRPCPNGSRFVVLGTWEYNRLFTMTGEGNTTTVVCGAHHNLLRAGKSINVHFVRNNHKENTMNNQPCNDFEPCLEVNGDRGCNNCGFKENEHQPSISFDFEDDCDDNNEGEPFQGTCDMCDREGTVQYGYSPRGSDGVKIPVIQHCVNGCPEVVEMARTCKNGVLIVPENMGVKSGKCHEYHAGPAEVRRCYGVNDYNTERANQLEKAHFNSGRKIPNPYKGR